MRKLLRSIARARMKREGITNVNKRLDRGCKSYFAEHWRDYIKH